jgi:hypothetical protein
MAEDKQTGSGFTGGNWILLAAAAVGTVYVSLQQPPLEGSRPAATPEFEVQDRHSIQHVDAHLWQDPLAAVQHAKDKEREEQARKGRCCYGTQDGNSSVEEGRKSHSIQTLRRRVQERKPLILGILVPGGPYAEDGEARLRLRYAVVSALDVAKYVPDDEEHIGYVNMKPDAQEPAPGSVSSVFSTVSDGTPVPPEGNTPPDRRPPTPDFIPFEWFHKGEYVDRKHAVLLLWIDERAFFTSPISSLADLRCQIDSSSLEGAGLGFALIGPQQSRTLAHMAAELHRGVRPPPVDCKHKQLSLVLDNFFVYNPSATTEETRLLKEAMLPDLSQIDQIFREENIHYYRTVGTDDTLAKALVAELKLRQIDPSTSGDHIALVSEWDTLYGRILPEVFAARFCSEQSVSKARCEENRIHKFSYLRGLDGQLPNAKAGAADAEPAGHDSGDDATPRSKDQSAGTPSNSGGDRERAEGQGQFDYLRRLAVHIRALDKTLRQEGNGEIKAIGILGSDVYDKLVILQALRPDFPEAQFFTNDLDALLLPQRKTRQTRDLLVASSFGLTMRKELQNDIPPFRNTYQTSAFFATELALRNVATKDTPPDLQKTLDEKWLQPRLFEIGRTDAYALPTSQASPQGQTPTEKDKEGVSEGCTLDDILKCSYINPVEAKLYPEFPTDPTLKVATACFIAFSLIALALCASRVRQFVAGPVQIGQRYPGLTSAGLLRFVLVLVGAGIPAALIVVWWPWIGNVLTDNGHGEPMFLKEGISIWPAITLRVASSFLSLFLICLALRSLKTNQTRTFEDMHLPEFGVGGAPKRERWGRLLRNISIFSIKKSTYYETANIYRYPVKRFLLQIYYRGLNKLRFLRAILATLMIMGLGYFLCLILGFPNVPARGVVAKNIYQLATISDVILSFLLTFLVVDATLLSRLFIRELGLVSSNWPTKTVEYYSAELRVSSPAIADWIDMQFIAKRTECITRLIYLPFIAMAFLVLSRNEVFTNFALSTALMVIWLCTGIIIIGSAMALRSTAEKARGIAIENLNTRLIAAKGKKWPGTAAQLEMLVNRVENLQDGVFAPWSSQPVVRAFFLPLLTYGASVLVHGYALPGF